MSQNIQAVPEATEDVEVLAARAREERQQRCSAALNKVLEEHNCTLSIVLKFGDQPIPIKEVVAVPAVVLTVSK